MKLVADTLTYQRLRWALGGALLIIVAIPSAGWVFSRPPADPNSLISSSPPDLPVTATGRIEPKDGVLTIAAPASAETGPAIVTALHVRQGEWVKAGQQLATLRGRTEVEAKLLGAQRSVALAQAKLDALKSGGKEDDLQALRAEVQGDEAALALATAQMKRAKQLRETGLLSSADLETQASRLAIATETLSASRARLRALSSVRPADVVVADAELRAADAAVEEMRSRLESTIVRAPSEGRVLAVYAQPGQMVGTDGVLALGKTSEMYVDAEVMEGDLPRTRVGQAARISGDVLSQPVDGTVEEIGYLVGSREVFRNDPTAFADSRIVHVKVRAKDPAQLERFINARVTVVIDP